MRINLIVLPALHQMSNGHGKVSAETMVDIRDAVNNLD